MLDKTNELVAQVATKGNGAVVDVTKITRDTATVYEVLILENEGVVRVAFCALLKDTMKTVSIHQASSYEEAIEILSRVKIDFAFLDIYLAPSGADEKSGIDVLKHIRSNHLDISVVMLSLNRTLTAIEGCINAGASGYIYKEMNSPDLENVMRDAMIKVLDGGIFIPDSCVSDRIRALSSVKPHLAAKEEEYLSYLCRTDYPPKKIASIMNIAESTAKGYGNSLYEKFEVHTRFDLMARVAQLDIRFPRSGHKRHPRRIIASNNT